MPGPDLLDPISDDTPLPGVRRASPPLEVSETEARILEAARDLLAEGGLEALSMRAVASRVGLSATALYHYFDNKEALVDCVVQHGFHRSEEYLRRAVEPLPRGSMERVAALGEAYIRFAFENRQYFKIIFSIRHEHPRAINDVPGQGGYVVLRESVVEAMEAGTIRRDDPDVVVLFLWSVVHGLVTIFMACDPAEMLGEVGLCGGDCGEPAAMIELFGRFRELIREGLEPPERVGHPRRAWLPAVQCVRRGIAVPPAQQALRAHQRHHHNQPQLRRMGPGLRGCQDDNRAPRSPHPPLPYPRNRQRQLPLQSQLRGCKEKTKGGARVDQNLTADKLPRWVSSR